MLQMFIVLSLAYQVISQCPHECECKDEPKQCPPGVSLVTDGCNCCKVCARQAGQECNDDDLVCDSHRGLFCDFSRAQKVQGRCRAQSGSPCDYYGVSIPSGGVFEPSCKMKCWCLDDSIGCVPMCPHEAHKPDQSLCPNARLRPVANQCCDEWICDTPEGGPKVLANSALWSATGVTGVGGGNVDRDSMLQMYSGVDSLSLNAVADEYYEEESITDIDQELFNQLRVAERRNEKFWIENEFPDPSVARVQQPNPNCQPKTSSWSSCSKTCGLGVSTRVSNINRRCVLNRETRLCFLRQCNHRYLPLHGNRKCTRQRRERQRTRITYAGCDSARSFKPLYCGECRETDRCCAPRSTRTTIMKFICPDGEMFRKNLMVIKSCRCRKNCSTRKNLSLGRGQDFSEI